MFCCSSAGPGPRAVLSSSEQEDVFPPGVQNLNCGAGVGFFLWVCLVFFFFKYCSLRDFPSTTHPKISSEVPLRFTWNLHLSLVCRVSCFRELF